MKPNTNRCWAQPTLLLATRPRGPSMVDSPADKPLWPWTSSNYKSISLTYMFGGSIKDETVDWRWASHAVGLRKMSLSIRRPQTADYATSWTLLSVNDLTALGAYATHSLSARPHYVSHAVCPSVPYLPLTRQRKALESPKLTTRFLHIMCISRTSFDVKRSKFKIASFAWIHNARTRYVQ